MLPPNVGGPPRPTTQEEFQTLQSSTDNNGRMLLNAVYPDPFLVPCSLKKTKTHSLDAARVPSSIVYHYRVPQPPFALALAAVC